MTSTAICGSDLHLYDGYIPTMQAGDILGHEFMGEVVEVGAEIDAEEGPARRRAVHDRVRQLLSLRQAPIFGVRQRQSRRQSGHRQELYGQPMSGLFGYSHLTGGYAGGQAEYVRVPFSDVGPIVIPDGVEDEKVLFLSDILPTGWMAAENAEIEPGDTVAVWGCGPVGLFAVQSAFLMGAERVIAIDHFPHRLELAKKFGAETINFEETATYEALMQMTGGIGPDAVIDAVGLEAHGFFVDNVIDQIKASTFLGTDRTHSIRQAIVACRKGGRVSMPAVYGGIVDKFPLGAFMEKGLTLKTGQTHVQHYMPGAAPRDHGGQDRYDLPDRHRMALEEAPKGYKMFHDNQNEVTKVVLKPGLAPLPLEEKNHGRQIRDHHRRIDRHRVRTGDDRRKGRI